MTTRVLTSGVTRGANWDLSSGHPSWIVRLLTGLEEVFPAQAVCQEHFFAVHILHIDIIGQCLMCFGVAKNSASIGEEFSLLAKCGT